MSDPYNSHGDTVNPRNTVVFRSNEPVSREPIDERYDEPLSPGAYEKAVKLNHAQRVQAALIDSTRILTDAERERLFLRLAVEYLADKVQIEAGCFLGAGVPLYIRELAYLRQFIIGLQKIHGESHEEVK